MENDIQKASEYVNNSKFNEAKDLLIKYINDNPNNSIFWNLLGLVFRNSGKLNEAYDCFMKATKIEPTYLSAYYNLGRLEGEYLSYHRYEDIRIAHKLCDKNDIIYSCFEEQNVLKKLVNEIGENNITKYCIDIGASDGLTFSNSYSLFNNNWKGLCIECDSEKFSHLTKVHEKFDTKLMNCFATPDNILDIFKIHNVPNNFGLLSLDIDSYDYYVLEQILTKYTPDIICAEISEYTPPPVCFALKYDENINIKDCRLVGQSISMLNKLLIKHNYSLIHLEYNNAFAIHNNKLNLLKSYTKLTPEIAYKNGLTERVDWKLKIPWNSESRQQIYNITDNNELINYIKNNVLIDNFDNYDLFLEEINSNLNDKLIDNLNSNLGENEIILPSYIKI